MDLFTPLRIGALDLPNRVVMAPMSRARSGADKVPTPMVAEYYAQRATAGLIITEATSVSPLSVSRPNTSAIYSGSHAEGWRLVAQRVHARGGRIFHQLYHMGRKSDPARLPAGEVPVAPSAIPAPPPNGGGNSYFALATPRAFATDEIPGVVAEFRRAAGLARGAGMDGVEIHGANGYLIEQFLKDATNRRTDRYGGSVANRARFLLEIVDAVAAEVGADRVGVRISPHYRDGISDRDPAALYRHVAAALAERNIAYLHIIEAHDPSARQAPAHGAARLLPIVRQAFPAPLIVNGAYSRASAAAVIASGAADLVSFGALFIANPDLVERLRRNAPFNAADRETFYAGGASGYIDYPMLEPACTGVSGSVR